VRRGQSVAYGFSVAAFLLLSACHIEGDKGLVTSPPTGTPITFQYVGPTQVVAGSYGGYWGILSSPQVFGGNRLHLTGPGTLMDGGRNVLDLTSSNLPNGGWYVPPATVPASGTTVTLSMEAYWQLTQQWCRSPDFTIQVVQQTSPMIFRLGTNPDGSSSPSNITLRPGQTSDALSGGTGAWWIYVHPWPFDPKPQFQLTSNQPQGTDIGSVDLVRPLDGQIWTFNFTAPPSIAGPIDVNIRAILHDPWFNLDPQVDFTVHLVPN